MIFSALVVRGKPLLAPGERDTMNRFFRSKEGKTIWIMVDGKRPGRTLSQLNYLWGVVYEFISDETGEEPESIHAEMKEKFLPRVYMRDDDGNEHALEKSTKRLSTKELTKFIENIRAWAGREHGITIPDPTQAEKIDV